MVCYSRFLPPFFACIFFLITLFFLFIYLYRSILSFFLPLRVDPYTDGFSWARKDGYEKHLGVHKGEELTDEDDDDF